MKRHFALTGFMGSGKTTFGKYVSQKSGRPFIDLDEYIEKKEGKTIVELFEQGEEKFRELESYYLKQVVELPDAHILALGGCSICKEENLELVLKHSYLFAIMPSVDTLVENLWEERDKRPLLKNITTKEELRKFVEAKLEERKPYYLRADWVLNVP